MPVVSIQQLLLAGTHFGHLTRRWNPKMSKYIFDARHGIHIIDLKKTQKCIDEACEALKEIVQRGEQVLFVGTKKQAKDIIKSEAARVGMPYVCERWLGGMLTNFSTIRKSLKRLQSLERQATDGTYEKISKKERLSIEREKAKLDKVLGGIREMKKLPGAVYITDIKKEHIALAEARKLSIPVFAIVDTNTDPDLVDYPIPGNDDAFKSIGLITRALSDAIAEAATVAAERGVVEEKETLVSFEERKKEKPSGRRRRPRRRPPVKANVEGESVRTEEKPAPSAAEAPIADNPDPTDKAETPPQPEPSSASEVKQETPAEQDKKAE
jgi:small subunit ribosomal protein S2